MRAPKRYEAKLRRVLDLEELLTHETTVNNTISILKHGLMSLRKVKDLGLEGDLSPYTNGFAGSEEEHGLVNLYKLPNSLPDIKDYTVISAYRPSLIIDNKYVTGCKERKDFLVYDGVIVPKDILAIVKTDSVFIPQNAEKLMNLQREKLPKTKWVPIFCKNLGFDSGNAGDKTSLYVPNWLEVSDEFKHLVDEKCQKASR